MSAILNFFTGIAEAIQGAIGFLLSLIEDIVYLGEVVVNASNAIPEFLSVLPAPVLSIVLSGVTIAVLFKVLGR